MKSWGLLFVVASAGWLTPSGTASATGDKVRTCETAVLKHDTKIVSSVWENQQTGYCSFRAVLPPSLNGSSKAASAVKALEPLRNGTTVDQIEYITKQVVPALVEALKEDLLEPQFASDGGFELTDFLDKNPKMLSECVMSMVNGEKFSVSEDFSLTCESDDKERNFLVVAQLKQVRVELWLPA